MSGLHPLDSVGSDDGRILMRLISYVKARRNFNVGNTLALGSGGFLGNGEKREAR